MKKILVIEDDKIINNIIEFLLKKEGYEIDIAKDGNEGFDKINQNNKVLIKSIRIITI